MSLIQVFPGQGSQKKGMGESLFERYPELVAEADRLLGYSIKQLCLEDPRGELAQTQFTQPALFVVNALSYHEKRDNSGKTPAFVAGHSLGEYSALYAAGAFDFATGLNLVRKRGELMSRVRGGGMLAVVGHTPERIAELLYNFAFDDLDAANYNSPSQTVISGPQEEINDVIPVLKEAGCTVIPLKVSGAFHSRMMKPVQEDFAKFLKGFEFRKLSIPVIANASARPYEDGCVPEMLARQMTSPVRWTETIHYLLQQEQPAFEEVGPGMVLTRLIAQIQAEAVSCK